MVTSGEVDGAALRARNRARIAADRSAVTMLQGGSPRELGERLCKAVVPARPKETPILIKPNLGGFEWFKDPAKSGGDDGVRGRITDPEFVRGIIRCLKARGHDKITIAEGWGAKHADWEKLVDVSGYEAMARDENVPPRRDGRRRRLRRRGRPARQAARRCAAWRRRTRRRCSWRRCSPSTSSAVSSSPRRRSRRTASASPRWPSRAGRASSCSRTPRRRSTRSGACTRSSSDALKLIPRTRRRGQKAYLDSLHVFAERMSRRPRGGEPARRPRRGRAGDGRRRLREALAVRRERGDRRDQPDPRRSRRRRVPRALGQRGARARARRAQDLAAHRDRGEALRGRHRVAAVEGDGAGAPRCAAARALRLDVAASRCTRTRAAAPGRRVDAGRGRREQSSGGRPVDARASASTTRRSRSTACAEAAWAAATPVTFDTDWSGAKTKATHARARALVEARALYMLWELEGAGLDVDASRPVKTERQKLYEEDCVELFLAPDPAERARYFEVEVGPLGHFFDIAVDRKTKKSDTAWSSEPQIATKVDRAQASRDHRDRAARARRRAARSRAGARLPFGLYRMEGKGRASTSRGARRGRRSRISTSRRRSARSSSSEPRRLSSRRAGRPSGGSGATMSSSVPCFLSGPALETWTSPRSPHVTRNGWSHASVVFDAASISSAVVAPRRSGSRRRGPSGRGRRSGGS